MNFRNYEGLELDFSPGMVLIQGGNGLGKSNLLEALYLLAIAKSPRVSADWELVRRQATGQETMAQVSAVVERDGRPVRVQIDFAASPAATYSEADAAPQVPDPISVQKHIRVNGVPRLTSELVGEVNAVMFSAQDLDLVLGSPTVRRRYLDILVSQTDRGYLRALQRYQRVLSQRNHLLKVVRERRAQPGELDFWDDELVASGKQIMHRRAATVQVLSQEAAPLHRELTHGSEQLQVLYRPSVEIRPGAPEDELGQSLRSAVEEQRDRDVAQGFTSSGPHRDDLQMLLDGIDAGLYASRGQCRTLAVAMRLAEARHLREQRGQEPILLLDDVLSELDAERRAHILDTAGQYQQCFITTADLYSIDRRHLARMSRFVVAGGRVEQQTSPGND